jgi:predicted DNA-binding transcriptional regulator YafY
VEALCETGVPVVATPGKGYRLVEGYFLPPLSFTSGEAAVLALGGEFVRLRVDGDLQRSAATAVDKLSAVLPEERRAEMARWMRELIFPSIREVAGEDRLKTIRAAIREQQLLRLLYHAFRRDGAEWRDVEPVSLVFLSEAWHLAAYCRLRQAPRIFRLDRIDQIAPLPERFELSPRHEHRPGGRDQMNRFPEARVRFDPEVERWARERQPYLFLREEFDSLGPVFVYALRDERELLPWLLSWGGGVEVIEPAALRESVAREARIALARHDRRPGAEQFSPTLSATATTVSVALP